jgi:hypothetical protein
VGSLHARGNCLTAARITGAAKVKPGGSAAWRGPCSRAWRAWLLVNYPLNQCRGGISLNGEQADDSGNRAMYGNRPWLDILDGRVTLPAASRALLASLDHYTATGE